MVAIYSFDGLRPKPELAEQIASEPYDVISSAEARKKVGNNELSFLHVVKPEIDLPEDVNIYDDAVYEKGAQNLRKLIDQGAMNWEGRQAIYVYRQIMGEQSQVGLMVCSAVDDYDNDLIKKHEFTRPEKEDDRTRHVDTHGAHAGPVFLTYRAVADIDALVDEKMKAQPTYDFVADNVQHTMWVVNEQEWIDAIIAEFKEVPALYVADGHHRAASASRVRTLRKERNPEHSGQEEYNRFLTVLFPHDQLAIMAYNRLVIDTGAQSKADVLNQLATSFDVIESDHQKPTKRHDIKMYMEGIWYQLTAKTSSYDDSDPIECLDVQVLQKHVLDNIFGITDPRTDKRVEFVGGIRGEQYLQEQVDQGKAAIAFVMYPTSIDELLDVADAKKVMPPKSTWFEPKLRSGLVVHTF